MSAMQVNSNCEMPMLNEALQVATLHAEGDPQMFALMLTAPIAAWMLAGAIDENVAMEAIDLLHQLHPGVQI